MSTTIALAESGALPDVVVRFGIRQMVRERLRQERAGGVGAMRSRRATRLAGLRSSAIALNTVQANQQHYEVPAAFFEQVLGGHLKYSACWWDRTCRTLDDAEEAMLALYARRAQLTDGQVVLDLGCGWGSFSLWLARHHRQSRITAVSNSVSQRMFIEQEAKRRGINNLRVITADVNSLDLAARRFDRVVSVEMFEHVRNYEVLLKRIAGWLKDDGRLFVHIFCHRELVYPFEVEGDGNWMGRHFFTGGLMPSADTLTTFQTHMRLEQQWQIDGTHYAKTARAWLTNLDTHRDNVRHTLLPLYGAGEVDRAIQRWRMFFMACEELFGFRRGTEWLVAHYRFSPVT